MPVRDCVPRMMCDNCDGKGWTYFEENVDSRLWVENEQFLSEFLGYSDIPFALYIEGSKCLVYLCETCDGVGTDASV
jgi:hypothetical protein